MRGTAERQAVAPPAATSAPLAYPGGPQLYLSSAAAGWDGLLAQAYHEPPELEDWITPAQRDIALILFTGGPMRLAQRQLNGRWQAQDMRTGDLILRSGTGPAYEVRWHGLSAESTRTLHLRLSRDLVTRTAAEVTGGDPARLKLVERAGFQDPLLAQIGFALWGELAQGAPTGKLYAQTAAQLLAVHLLRPYSAGGTAIEEPAPGLTPRQVRRVADFVQAHLAEDLTLAALAQQTGFSPYHFARLFRRTTGESPHQFVLRRRIECAQRLLQKPRIPLAQVALESGFADQSHLTQAFKRHLGLTPRAYQREYTSTVAL